MTVADRAKQFAPFSALRGLPEELAQKERIYQPRKILSSDMAEQLDRMLQTVHPGHMVTVVYYRGGILQCACDHEIFCTADEKKIKRQV